MSKHEEDSVRAEPAANLSSVQASAPKKWQTAPWPHPMTYVIGALSPGLALVALYLSFQSLGASRESTRRGQQAYLAIPQAKFQFHQEGVGPQGEQGIVYLDLTFTIQNVGNTPATIFDAAVEWLLEDISHLVPAGTVVHTEGRVSLPKGELGPHSSTREAQYVFRLYRNGRELVLPRKDADEVQAINITKGLRVRGRALYKTVFTDDLLQKRWCWQTAGGNTGVTTSCPADPDQVHRELSR